MTGFATHPVCESSTQAPTAHCALPSKRMPGAWRLRLGAIALAMLCTAPSGAVAAAPRSSAASSPATVRTPAAFTRFVAEAARHFDIPADWIAAVMRVESNGDARAISSKGAMGLMQIMPQTWADLQQRYHLGADPFDPRDNILAGAGYLHELYRRFGPARFLAAYQAGPSRVMEAMSGGHMLGPDSRAYLQRLARLLPDLPLQSGRFAEDCASDWRAADLFVTPAAAIGDTTVALIPRSQGLFVVVRKASRP